MKLTVLGAGHGAAGYRAEPRGYLLEVGDEALLFDLGPGTLARLAAAGVKPTVGSGASSSRICTPSRARSRDAAAGQQCDARWTREEAVGAGAARARDVRSRASHCSSTHGAREFPIRITEMGNERRQFEVDFETASRSHTPESIGFRVEADGATVGLFGRRGRVPSTAQSRPRRHVFVCECLISARLAYLRSRHRGRGRPDGPDRERPALSSHISTRRRRRPMSPGRPGPNMREVVVAGRRPDRQVLAASSDMSERASGSAARCAIHTPTVWLGLMPFFLFATAFEVLPILLLYGRASPTRWAGARQLPSGPHPMMLNRFGNSIQLSFVTATARRGVRGGARSSRTAIVTTRTATCAAPSPRSRRIRQLGGAPLAFAFIITLGVDRVVTLLLARSA